MFAPFLEDRDDVICSPLLWYYGLVNTFFSNLACIPSAPGALSVLRSCSFFWISASYRDVSHRIYFAASLAMFV